MRRRGFLAAGAAAGALALAGCRLKNPCLGPALPGTLADHDVVRAAWEGIAPDRLWDVHVHLLGTGDSGGGAWVNPRMQSWWHPIEYVRYRAFLNAGCVGDFEAVDREYADRLLACRAALHPESRVAVLAFDHAHDEEGIRRQEHSAFHVPDAYAMATAMADPKVEWIASIHPYRADALEALRAAATGGAIAIKWLPNAMGMDPASPKCDRFYAALAGSGLPLLTHSGTERAVRGTGTQHLGNPLRLRRALDHGVRVIVAHCGSLGTGVDLDRGADGPELPNVDLFARMMGEARYEGLLFGDVSALTQKNRLGRPLEIVLSNPQWHSRLITGSDYPLPAIAPLFSVREMHERGYLPGPAVAVIDEIQRHNPLAFDFVLKRTIRFDGRGFSPDVFDSARILGRGRA